MRAILGASKVPVQVGGGIRDVVTIQRYLDAGADRVVLGTTAVKDQTSLMNAIVLFRERLVVGVDARHGVVYRAVIVTTGPLPMSKSTVNAPAAPV